jgi:hypothetical protein
LEFGVWHGRSLRQLAARFPDDVIYGFDSFEGLPVTWGANPVGSYSAQVRHFYCIPAGLGIPAGRNVTFDSSSDSQLIASIWFNYSSRNGRL